LLLHCHNRKQSLEYCKGILACDLAKVANAFEIGHVIFVQARKVLVHAKLHLLYLSIA